MYRKLNPDSIVKTAMRLHKRCEERFPKRGISDVCAELVDVLTKNKSRAAELKQPDWILRAIVAAIIVAGAITFMYVGTFLNFSRISAGAFGVVQGVEATINTLVLAGLAFIFLFNSERRKKRRLALEALHELRSLAHVIDMHQLTKDPQTLLKGGPKTKSSPERKMNEFLLTRYLDYCSEMLSLCGKAAALYAQNLKDPVVIAAVNEIEVLSTNLSRKIWQKIVIIHQDSNNGDPSHDEIKASLMEVAGR